MKILLASLLMVSGQSVAPGSQAGDPGDMQAGARRPCSAGLLEPAARADESALREVLDLLEESTRAPDARGSLCDAELARLAALVEGEDVSLAIQAVIILGNLGSESAPYVPNIERAIAVLQAREDAMMIKPSQPVTVDFHEALTKIDGRPFPEFP